METKEEPQQNTNTGTSIWIPVYLKDMLDREKLHPREPYYQVIERVFGGSVNGRSR
jgi:hypothetical protein